MNIAETLRNRFLPLYNELVGDEKPIVEALTLELFPKTSLHLNETFWKYKSKNTQMYRFGEYRSQFCIHSKYTESEYTYVLRPELRIATLIGLGVKEVDKRIKKRQKESRGLFGMDEFMQKKDDFLLALTQYVCGEPITPSGELGDFEMPIRAIATQVYELIEFMIKNGSLFDPFLTRVTCKNIPLKFLEDIIYDVPDMKSEPSVMLKRIYKYDFDSGLKRAKQYLNEYVFYNEFCKDGNFDVALDSVPKDSLQYRVLKAMRLLSQNKAAEAVKTLEKGMEKILCYRDSVYSLVYMMAVYADNPKINHFDRLLRITKNAKNDHTFVSSWLFAMMAMDYDIDNWRDNEALNGLVSDSNYALYLTLVFFGLDDRLSDECKAEKEASLKSSKFAILRYLYAQLRGSEKEKRETVQVIGLPNIWPARRTSKKWETNLLQIEALLNGEKDNKPKRSSDKTWHRVAYLVNVHTLDVTPRMQKSRDGVNWTGGRNIALSKFADLIPEQTRQDIRVAKLVRSPYYSSYSYYLSGVEVFKALVGHPYVFREDSPDMKVEIVSEPPQFTILRTPEGFKVQCNIKNIEKKMSELFIVEESYQRINVVELTDFQMQIIKLLTSLGQLPLEAEERLKSVLGQIGSQVTVLSDLVADVSPDTIAVEGDSTIVAQLMPVGEDVRMRLYVKPFTDKPPYCEPGEGLEYVAANIDGKQAQAHRDLVKETDNLEELQKGLEPYGQYQGEDGWELPPAACLDVIALIQRMSDKCRAEWPEGVKYKVKRFMITGDNVNFKLHRSGQWFELDGSITVGSDIKMRIEEMLDLIHSRQGNFVQMGDNEFVELSEGLRKQLQQLGNLVKTTGKTKMRLSPFSAIALGNLGESGATVEADEEYDRLMQRIDESSKQKYKIPKNIQADLRDYQKEAYEWMSALAYWGGGALLADDMGLGKTVEAITVMLSRAKDGPQLVVAPTSVLLNWKSEIERFAPDLTPMVLNTLGVDRKKIVNGAGKFDVVITSYGLLVTEEELLEKKKWNTIVLDEAHTIKNKDTKMSKSAMLLEGDFRLMLTGTPLQNHLSEIWNLFEFANPGLLGSYNDFIDRFLVPVEKNQDKDQQRVLRGIVQPFILRRTKNDVLNQLPQKTEIMLKVQLSPEEMAFYDRIRANALAALENGESNPMQTLAEITRLRQAACNLRLLEPKLPIESSKAAAFMNLVEELKANHHRALVFSQFTSHLALIREILDKAEIKYEYLDGSTTPAKRAKLVKQFQTGDAPLFLISLKAGGLGLNLTAADYVIHLDPWWNPAIEDQASDRAHRMGQTKPVTVYRIIAAGTIEDKIIELHKTKKSMADALLEGSDIATKMTKEVMLKLLTTK